MVEHTYNSDTSINTLGKNYKKIQNPIENHNTQCIPRFLTVACSFLLYVDYC